MPDSTFQLPAPAPLGIFDSGYGGLTVLRAVHEALPQCSTLYLGDNARAPYGTRTEEEIFRFTLEGVRFLFSRGCPLVVVACNTASASALRRIQRKVLPKEYPDRRVLGVIRPYAEAAAAATTNGHIAVLGTEATIASGAYSRELKSAMTDVERPVPGRPTSVRVTEVAIASLAGLVEAGEEQGKEATGGIRDALKKLSKSDPAIDTVLLGCTHFPLVEKAFAKGLKNGMRLLSQAETVADRLVDYLHRHPDMDARLEKDGRRAYATTAPSAVVSKLATRFYGQPLKFDTVELDVSS